MKTTTTTSMSTSGGAIAIVGGRGREMTTAGADPTTKAEFENEIGGIDRPAAAEATEAGGIVVAKSPRCRPANHRRRHRIGRRPRPELA